MALEKVSKLDWGKMRLVLSQFWDLLAVSYLSDWMMYALLSLSFVIGSQSQAMILLLGQMCYGQNYPLSSPNTCLYLVQS